MDSFQKILTPQPHFVNGYGGFVPGYIIACGQSYGKLTHNLFFDKTVKRSNVPVLSDLNKVYADTVCTPEEEVSINKRCENNLNCKYTTDIMTGYDGYVPQYTFLCGNNYTADATRGIKNFIKIQNACLCPECEQKRGNSVKFDKKILDDEAGALKSSNKYRHPFEKDLEAEQLFKEKYKSTLPIPPSDTTYFLENGNPHKKFMAGYTGHVPKLIFEFGQSYTPATKDALNIFTEEYVKHKSTLLL